MLVKMYVSGKELQEHFDVGLSIPTALADGLGQSLVLKSS
jgi:hypothetical protein